MKKFTTSILAICLVVITITVKAQSFTNYTTTNSGLPHNNVNCLVEDGQGNMWFGTSSGVAKFDGVSTWTVYNTTTNPILPDNIITAIAVDNADNIWIGTDFGVSVFDGTNFVTYTTADGLGHNRIKHIAQAPNGDVWLGDFAGVTKYSSSTFAAYGTTDGLPFGGVSYVDFTANGDVYMANGIFGFIKYDGASFTIYNTSSGLLSNNVRSITVDANDNKWVGTAHGISVFDNTNTLIDAHTIMYVLPGSDTLNPVVDVKINSQGDVWSALNVDYLSLGAIAVNTGGSSWDDYDKINDGLVGDNVLKITIDHLDNVWVGTTQGVSKWLSTSTGIDNNAFASNESSVYPNPTTANTKLLTNLTNSDVSIIDITGKEIYTQNNVSASELTLPTSNLKSGLYFVKVTSETSQEVIKLIKN